MKQKQMFFWISLAFSMIQQMLAIWSLVSLPFLNQIYSHRFFSYCVCVCSVIPKRCQQGPPRHTQSVDKLCLTLCDLMDSSQPGSSVHGIFQARILGWVAISYSRGSSWPRNQTHISCISCNDRQIFYHCVTWEASQGYTDHDKKESQSQDLQGNNLPKVLKTGVTS